MSFLLSLKNKNKNQRIFQKIYTICVIFLFVFSFVFAFASTTFATLYAPGTTLEPDCPPTESLSTCGVNIGAVSAGGTGITSYSIGDLLYASGVSTLSKLAIGTNGQVLKVSGGDIIWGSGTSQNIGDTDLTLTGNRTLTLDGKLLTFSGTSGSLVFNDDGSLTLGDGINLTLSQDSISTAETGLNIKSNGASTGTIQIGVGGAGTTAPDIFALDVKSNAGDPTGFDGAMYFNAVSGDFRCYEEGSWNDCIFHPTDSAQNLTLARIGNSTFSTLQQMQNVFHSSGWTSGGAITDAGSETIDVATGTGLIRTSNDAINGIVSYFDWPAVSGVAIPTNTVRYVGIEYNSGTPQVSVRTSANWNLKTDFPIGVVVNESGTLSIFTDFLAVGDHAANMIQREYETMPLSPDVRSGGLVLGETGTRKVTLSAGAVWDRLNRYEIPAFNTNVSGNFDAYYMDGSGGFTKVANLTQWPNTKYDDESGTLATLTDGNYATLWFYVDTNSRISMVYGMGEYTTAALADAEMMPDVDMLPDKLRVFGKLLGKVVFQKSASTAVEVTSLISMSEGSSASVTNHSNLSALDYASSGHTGFANALAGVNDNITSATGLTSITPGAAITITAGGASVWSTNSGSLTIDSASALNLGTTNATSVGISKAGVETTINGGLKIIGNYVTPRGTPITTTGTLNDLVLSDGSYYHYEGVSTATITGIAGGVDGREVHIFNDSSSNLVIAHLNAGSSASNQIETPTGENVTLVPNLMIGLIYDAQTNVWHLDTLPTTREGISSYAILQSGNAFGAAASLGTTDAYGLNFITSGATRFGVASGSATLTGTGATTITTDDTLTLSSAASKALNITSGTTGVLTLDTGTTGALNIGTGSSAKTITLGNITGATAFNINTGTGGSALTTTNGIFTLNTGTGAINIGTDAVAKTITLGNLTGATALNINAGSGGGNFVSSSGLNFNPFGTSAGNTSEIRFSELVANGANYVGFKSPDTLAGNVIWTLPNAAGTVGQVLTTDASNNLSWASAGACPTCVVNTSKFTVDANGDITKLNNVVVSFPSSQGGASTVLTNDGSGNLTWGASGAGSAALSGVTAAAGDATIGNGNSNINWNWTLSGATNGFNISETTASSGTGYLTRISTLATSTAKPFSLGARGTTIFDTTATGGLTIGDSATLNTPITLQSGTGAINIGADAVAKTITLGNTTGATAVNINSGSGGINFGGATTVSGSNTFTTGTGVTTINSASINLAGNSSILDMTGTGTLGLNTTTNRAITTGSGLFTVGGALTVSGTTTMNGSLIVIGNYSTPKGADYITTGSQDDVNLGVGSYFLYTGAGTATFTGISGGTDGRQIRITNTSSSNLTITNQDTGSVAANRVITPSGTSVIIGQNVTVGFEYDSSASRWRIVTIPASASSISSFGFLQSGNAFGATATLGTTDANALNFITGGATRFTLAAGANTLTGNGATSITTSSGSLTLDATTALNLGTSTATSLSVGRTGVTTTNNGALTSTQTLTASNGLTLTTGALNLTATSGILDIGSTVFAGASPFVFEGATADAFETTFALTDPTADRTITFPDGSITVNAAGNISGTTLASNVITSSLTTVGALASGSIASGFGSIATTNNITTSANISSTGSGTITSAGAFTASNGLTLTTGALNLTATSGVLDIGSTALSGASPIVFEGVTADAFETTFTLTDPTADRTITFPNNSIIINAAGDITGTTLASNVVTSSLTTVGALTSGSIASGFTSINGTPIGASSANTGRFSSLTSTGATDIANAGASNVTIATTGSGNVTIGNATGTFALTSNGGLNITTGGVLTGVSSIGAYSLAGTLDANTNILTNIGNTGTDFVATTGALTLAGVLTANGGISIAANALTGTTGIIDYTNFDVNASGNVDIGGTLTVGSGNEIITLSTGKIDADALTLISAVDGGTGTSSGSGFISRSDGIGLLQGCTDGQILKWVESTDTWDCATDATGSGGTPNMNSFTDTTTEAVVDGDTTDYWDGTYPNITPSSASNEVLVMMTANIASSSNTDTQITFQIMRHTSAITCQSVGTAVGGQVGTFQGFSTAGSTNISAVFVDTPATTSNVQYTLCSEADSEGAVGTMSRIDFTLYEINDAADLAEVYSTNDSSIQAGDVVSLDSLLQAGVKKSTGLNDQNLLGIVSTKPALLIGGTNNEGVSAVPVALSGRVPVKVVTENGNIQPGDYLTSSSTPGVAMKSNGVGPAIGQALSSFDGDGVGVVVVFVKNFDMGNIGQVGVLLGDISPKINADGTDNGLSLLITNIQTEEPRDPVLIINKKISEGKEFLLDFVSTRITAIRGYFDEIFTKKIHTEQICVKKSDGDDVCVNGDQLNVLLNNNNIPSTIINSSFSSPEQTPTPIEDVAQILDSIEVVDSVSDSFSSPDSSPEQTPTPIEEVAQILDPAPESVSESTSVSD